MDAQTQARERLQAAILQALFRHTRRDEIVLKGGMALRVGLDSHRLTKDIDISANPNAALGALRRKTREAIQAAIRQMGLADAEIDEHKMTDTTSRWKIRGRLPEGLEVHLTVEMSRRPPFSEKHIQTKVYSPPKEYRIGAFVVNLYDEAALTVAKIMALTDDIRTAPRDLYDLHLLIEQGASPAKDLFDQISADVLKERLERLSAKLEIMKWPLFEQEVMPYLPEDVVSRLNERWYEDMKMAVFATVLEWLEAAIQSAKPSEQATKLESPQL